MSAVSPLDYTPEFVDGFGEPFVADVAGPSTDSTHVNIAAQPGVDVSQRALYCYVAGAWFPVENVAGLVDPIGTAMQSLDQRQGASCALYHAAILQWGPMPADESPAAAPYVSGVSGSDARGGVGTILLAILFMVATTIWSRRSIHGASRSPRRFGRRN